GEPVETGSLAIRAYGVVLHEITLEEIKELPSVRRTMSIRSSSGTTSHSFRGTLLANVLELADPSIAEDYKWLRTVGVDDYMSDITMEEVQMENNVFLMYEDNGEPLPRKNGEPGAMRIVVIDDMFGQRFTNYVLEVVLEGGST
ncbi:MAG: molybdopterin-dependent oxidoreductase, partial [Clostridiales bacterium]|nr:molybdopterin-dependent oxidoreductase [Clostridiales bacterium]